MRKLTLITAAAVGTALAFAAAPASAQYRPVQQGYPGQYAPQPQGYAYGYNNNQGNYGLARAMQARIDGIQRQVQQLRARRLITRDEANGLRSESYRIEQRLRQSTRYGLNPNEARNIEYRIARLERHVSHEVRDGRGRYGYNNGYNNNGYNRGYVDRDRDGRDDRYEDDRGTRHDHH